MTPPPRRHSRPTPEPVGETLITPEQAQRATRVIAAHYRADPATARHLLDMLGLLDAAHRIRHRDHPDRP